MSPRPIAPVPPESEADRRERLARQAEAIARAFAGPKRPHGKAARGQR